MNKSEYPTIYDSDSLTCPWCEAEQDVCSDINQGEEIDCDNNKCGKKFVVIGVETKYEYSTRGIPGGSKTTDDGKIIVMRNMSCGQCLYFPKGMDMKCPIKKVEVCAEDVKCTIETIEEGQ